MEENVNENNVEPIVQQTNFEGPKKNKHKGLIITLIILLVVAIAGALIWFFVIRKDSNPEKPKNDIVKKDIQSVYPPENVEINELEHGPAVGFSIECMKEGTLDYVNKVPVKKGDIVTCSYGLELSYKIETVYYQFDYGNGLKLLEVKKTNDDASNKMEGNRVSDVYAKPKSVIDSSYKFRFEVLDDSDTKNLVFRISNIVIKTISNDYYKLDDEVVTFKNNSKLFYIYEYKSDDYKSIYISSNKTDEKDYKYLNEYKCNSEECYDEDNRGNYVLFNDGNYVAFNYVTNEKKDLSDFKKYSIALVANTKLIGLIVRDGDKEGYYSLEKNKYIIDLKKDQYLNVFDNFIYLSYEDDKNEKLIDYSGNDFVPTSKDLSKIEGTEFYYVDAGMNGSVYFFFNKDGKALFNGESFGSYFQSAYKVSKKGNLVLNYNNKFVEYNINEEVVFESKEYNDLDFIDKDYIAVVDKDYKLKLIDDEENEIYEFATLRKDNYIHWALSGYYEYQNKNGIYIVVQDDSITDKELLDGLKAQGEEIEDYTLESDRGYEYYYIPETKEGGKFVTVIGGYAKPVLYLYPEKETTVTVNFEHEDKLTTTYPKFKDEWKVLAKPNGDLYDKDGKYYYGLYWEEDLNHYVDFHEGFYVTKENAIEFLEEKLSLIGLNDRERNEFIMYWLPILEKNGKSLVYFELTEERDSYNKMKINPQPDSVLRLAIHVKKVSNKVNIKEEKLETFERRGFAAVEWGGVIYK